MSLKHNFSLLSADRWKETRPILTPAFTSSKMKMMFNIMEDCSRRFANYFQNEGSETVEVELKDIFTRYTNDVIASTTFGIEIDSLKDKNNEFYRMGRVFSNILNGTALLKIFFYTAFATPMKVKAVSCNCNFLTVFF